MKDWNSGDKDGPGAEEIPGAEEDPGADEDPGTGGGCSGGARRI